MGGAPVKRVLFVDHTPFIGGAQLVLVEHIRHIDRTEFEPVVACTNAVPRLTEAFREAGAEVHQIPMGRLRTGNPLVLARWLHSAWRLRRLIRREAIDIVVTNTSRAAYVASVAVPGTGAALVWSVRDFLYGSRIFHLLEGVPRKIVCVSDAVREHYDGLGDPKFETVYVGSSLHRRLERVTAAQIAAERARWGIGPEEVVVGFMGRLVADKGPQDVVAAAKLLADSYPRLRCLILGTGNGQEGDVEDRLRHEVEEAGLTERVVLAGHQSDEALYYSVLDIFVLSTRTPEPYATSVVQAMMAGKPVVATATGGTPELVEHRRTGLLVAPSAPEEMARAIRELVDDPTLAEEMARSARAHVLEHNREETITGEFERIYRAL
jgi:glycosyltransferase involved in cell wall biosynthesis